MSEPVLVQPTRVSTSAAVAVAAPVAVDWLPEPAKAGVAAARTPMAVRVGLAPPAEV